MKNVIDFSAYRSRKIPAETPASGPADVVQVPRSIPLPMREQEILMLSRILAALTDAQASGDASELAEWRDELEAMAMHTDYADIRERCRWALGQTGRR
ncbi:hypothetical protein [Rhizobium leguminosarum]|uniref:hypothetical protein n=1 Tax=Rhizobium leguminosarum TaxID=384 RepID=UPI0024B3BD61|nr:hypothetical protein [Rhizobium leguminosarum]WHO77461.1 hypothetical protein QMO81_000089 [Rhizobium leguminosarum]